MTKFWAVVNDSPFEKRFTCKHTTLESARREAGRLARENREHNFMIVELVGHVGIPETPVVFVEATDGRTSGDAVSPGDDDDHGEEDEVPFFSS